MAKELKATIINMKSLSQDIVDPVVVGAGEAAGRALRVIFTQEAAAQFTPSTKVYLSWYHQEKNIKGYNVFTQIIDEDDEDFPPTWEIHYPKSMLYEGNVLACIQIVDEVSISTSVNFTIHVLLDPNDGSAFTATDDFTEFQQAVISLASAEQEARNQMAEHQSKFEEMQLEFENVKAESEDAKRIAEEAKQISENALGVASEALETIEDFTVVAKELQVQEQENKARIDRVEQTADRALEKTELIANNVADVAVAVREVAEQISKISHNSGIDREELISLIQQEIGGTYATTDQLNNFIEEAQEEHASIRQALQFVEED